MVERLEWFDKNVEAEVGRTKVWVVTSGDKYFNGFIEGAWSFGFFGTEFEDFGAMTYALRRLLDLNGPFDITNIRAELREAYLLGLEEAKLCATLVSARTTVHNCLAPSATQHGVS